MAFNLVAGLVGGAASGLLGGLLGGGGPKEDPLRRVLRLRLARMLKEHGPEVIANLLLWAQMQDRLGAGPDTATSQKAVQRVRRVGTSAIENLGHLYSIQGFGGSGAMPERTRHSAATDQDIRIAAEMAGLSRPSDMTSVLLGALDPRRAVSLPSPQSIRNQMMMDDEKLYGALGQLIAQHAPDIVKWFRGSSQGVYPWVPSKEQFI